jgi:hypothetical protein
LLDAVDMSKPEPTPTDKPAKGQADSEEAVDVPASAMVSSDAQAPVAGAVSGYDVEAAWEGARC